MTIKRLTFVRRSAQMPVDGFAACWREQALQTQRSAPDGAEPRRVVHCIVRPGRAERPFHGVAIEWFADEVALVAHDAAAATVPADGLLDAAATVHVRVWDRVVFGQPLLDDWWRVADGASRMILLGVIHRQESLTRDEFADYWWSQHRPLANRLLPAEVWPPIYVHDYVLPGEAWPWDGVGEFYEDSLDVAKARTQWAERAEAAPIVHDEEQFLVRDTRWSLVTDATVVIAGE